jgi:hypothetical protein
MFLEALSLVSELTSNGEGGGGKGGILSSLQNGLSQFGGLFKSKGGTETDWQGWDEQDRRNGQWFPASTVRGYVYTDGDDAALEARNIRAYIQANGLQNLIASGHKYSVPGQGHRDVTVQEIADKFRRGGLYQEATELMQYYNELQQKSAAQNSSKNNSVDADTVRGSVKPDNDAANNKGGNTWLYILIGVLSAVVIGVVIYVTQKK